MKYLISSKLLFVFTENCHELPENFQKINFLLQIFWSSSLIFIPKPSIEDAFIGYFEFAEFTLIYELLFFFGLKITAKSTSTTNA